MEAKRKRGKWEVGGAVEGEGQGTERRSERASGGSGCESGINGRHLPPIPSLSLAPSLSPSPSPSASPAPCKAEGCSGDGSVVGDNGGDVRMRRRKQ